MQLLSGGYQGIDATAWPRVALWPVERVAQLSSVLVKQGAVGHSIALLVAHRSGPVACFP